MDYDVNDAELIEFFDKLLAFGYKSTLGKRAMDRKTDLIAKLNDKSIDDGGIIRTGSINPVRNTCSK